jgi:hypothetical protein
MALRSSVVLVGFVALASCSSSKSTPSATSDDGGAGGVDGGAGTSYALKYTTAPSQETHWCEYKKMPKSAGGDLLVSGVSWSWKAAHHWGLYRLVPNAPVATLPLDTPFDCFSPEGAMQYAQFSTSFLQGEATGTIDFPAGTAFPFASEEVVMFQTHSINTGAAPAAVEVDLSFRVADAASVKDRLGLIQFFDPYIVVPAHADAVAQMRCKVPADITLVRSTTHEHSRGTKVETFLDAADGTKATTPFLSSTNWDLPQISTDPVKVANGQYLRTVCHYTGDEHPVVTQGQFKGDKEMCMTIAYYYPAIEDPNVRPLFENCVQNPLVLPAGKIASYGDSFGTGAVACGATLQCVQNVLGKDPKEAPNPHDGQIDVGPNFQKCVVDSCPSASEPLFTMLGCVQQNCQAACADPTKCQPCVLDKCSTELSACTDHVCK